VKRITFSSFKLYHTVIVIKKNFFTCHKTDTE